MAASTNLYLRSYAQKPGSGVKDLYLRSDADKIPVARRTNVYSQAVARAAFWTIPAAVVVTLVV